MEIGKTYWFVSERDQVEQGRLISFGASVVCYQTVSDAIHFGNINEVYNTEGEAKMGWEYVVKRKVIGFTQDLFNVFQVTGCCHLDTYLKEILDGGGRYFVITVTVDSTFTAERIEELNTRWHNEIGSVVASGDFRLIVRIAPTRSK